MRKLMFISKFYLLNTEYILFMTNNECLIEIQFLGSIEWSSKKCLDETVDESCI